jgi:hypothetical protein
VWSPASACRRAGVARVHTHALLDIFHRISMAAMIAGSNCIIPLSGQAVPTLRGGRMGRSR